MRKLPIITSMAYIPLSYVEDADALRDRLTIEVNPIPGLAAEDSYAPAIAKGEETQYVEAFDMSKPGYIGVPRHFGLSEFSDIHFIDRTSNGGEVDGEYPQGLIKPRTQQQARFMRHLADVCTADGPVDYVANARTGSGKTVSDLHLATELLVPELVVVHTNRLKVQWIGNLKKKHGMRYFFGEDWVEKYVGIAQQDRCDFEGKLVVVGLLPSLARRDYGPEFYRHFGKITFDEVHKCAAPLMSEVLKKFPARVRGGYTATNREDALRQLCNWHLGHPRIVSQQEVLKPKVFIVPWRKTKRMYEGTEWAMVSSIAQWNERNDFLARIIHQRGYARDRVVLVLSDRVNQLQYLRDKLIAQGVPKETIGLYVGAYETGMVKATVKVSGKRHRMGTFRTGYEAKKQILKWLEENIEDFNARSTEYDINITKEKIKPTDAELDWISDNCSIVLATYGIFDTGNDVSRIDMGVEATPRGNVKQAVGRILRVHEGKPTPEWYSINDIIASPSTGKVYEFFEKRARSRMRSFEMHKATIKTIGWKKRNA